jgi:hypothetical protein
MQIEMRSQAFLKWYLLSLESKVNTMIVFNAMRIRASPVCIFIIELTITVVKKLH